jgi:phosphoribosyl 1,2-cyclic phosphodiesterase
MRLTILSSGSGGNSLCVHTASTAVYIDAGLRKGRLRERWQRVPAEAALAGQAGAGGRPRPSAAFLTHEHGDHVAGADDLAAAGLSLYATAPTAAAIGLSPRGRQMVREVAAGQPVVHGDLQILPVSLPHDAAAPVAYVISDGTLRLGVITDCGRPSAELASAFADCDALVLETNHDRRMLFAGPYPERLKRRIVSGHGHLSNEQAGELLSGILAASRVEPAVVICAHLSKVNNRPELAARAVRAVLVGRPTTVVVAEQDHPASPRQLLAGRRIPRAEQLSLSL